jgi:hypothetical protein
MAGTAFYRALIALETDATRYYGPDARRPALLGRADAEQLLAHVAADLGALLPDIGACSLIAAGALFDQTQILRPGYPAFSALEAVSLNDDPARFRPGLVSLGADDGSMPDRALQPDPDIPPGLLQLLPLVVHGPAMTVEALGQAMEYRFLEEGQLSAHSASWLQGAFGVVINHARFMTLTDLNAMLRLQLEHFGFLPLWELLDAALSGAAGPLAVRGQHGVELEWREGAIHLRFETFDFWATEGAGAALPAARQALAESYANWTRETRQYLTTLAAHGLDVVFHHPRDDRVLDGPYFSEPGLALPGSRRAAVTEHSFGDIGIISVTTVDGEEVLNHYPLSADGLNAMHAGIRRRVPQGHTISFPGSLLYDEESRRLVADTREPSGS